MAPTYVHGMNTGATDGYGLLTEREKQTLRLIVRGHDAKSVARHLDLSVHTVNDRLRDARRKLAVSSSREAARLLLDREGPQFLAPERIGDAGEGVGGASPTVPVSARRGRLGWIAAGAIVMSLFIALLALASPQATTAPTARTAAARHDPAVEAAARRFLLLVDQEKWADAYRLTGSVFRRLNTEKLWADVSEKVRPPLGATVSRGFVSQQNLPAPPNGFELVTFRTSFANKADTDETVTLERENGAWKVVGVTVG